MEKHKLSLMQSENGHSIRMIMDGEDISERVQDLSLHFGGGVVSLGYTKSFVDIPVKLVPLSENTPMEDKNNDD